ncbi:Tim10/DDP family zinc finger-domain-containing protein [Armillaria mellea]|nr:Tim10/DDP family zinc finger-domain-containing protein [Armillaria mellea]
MSDFFKSPFGSKSSSSSPTPSENEKKEQIMNAVRTEIAQANAQLLMNNMNERCFKACVTRPGASLSSSEETCLTRCMERFMDTFNIVSRSYTARLSRERLDSITSDFEKTP